MVTSNLIFKLKGGNNMKVRRLGIVSVITIAFVLGLFLSAWGGAQKEEREGYKKEVQEKLNALDKKIAELKGKASELKGEAKTEFNKEMTGLHKKQKSAKKEWGKVKSAAADKWEKVKSDMNAAVQDVEDAYNKVVSRFKEHKD
jgi:DNA repair exonuclease SbcCD ATPase subunit